MQILTGIILTVWLLVMMSFNVKAESITNNQFISISSNFEYYQDTTPYNVTTTIYDFTNISEANNTFLYTYGSEIGFLNYGIAYQVISLIFEFILIAMSATPLISKKGRTWQKKVLLACCLSASVMEFAAQPFDVLKVFHPVQDKSVGNVGILILPVFLAKLQFHSIFGIFVYLFFPINRIILTIAERMNTKKKREEMKEHYKRVLLQAIAAKKPTHTNASVSHNTLERPRASSLDSVHSNSHLIHHAISPVHSTSTPGNKTPPPPLNSNIFSTIGSPTSLVPSVNSVSSPMNDELWYMRKQTLSPTSNQTLILPNVQLRTSLDITTSNIQPSVSTLGNVSNSGGELKILTKNSLLLPSNIPDSRRGSTASNASNFSDTSVSGLLVPNAKKYLFDPNISRERKNSNSSTNSQMSEMEKTLALAVPTNSFYEKYPSSKLVKIIKLIKFTMVAVLVLDIIIALIDIIALGIFYLWDLVGPTNTAFFATLDIYPIVALVLAVILSFMMVLFALVNLSQIIALTMILYLHPDHDDSIKSAVLGHPLPSSVGSTGPLKVALETIEENRVRLVISSAVIISQLFVAVFVAMYPILYHSMMIQGMSFLFQIIYYFGRRIGTFAAILTIYMLYSPFFHMYHSITKIPTTKNKRILFFR